jgi:hypothetical protein
MPKQPKGTKKTDTVSDRSEVWAIRLDLPPGDYERVERCAKRRGLTKASYCRMAVLDYLERDEARSAK